MLLVQALCWVLILFQAHVYVVIHRLIKHVALTLFRLVKHFLLDAEFVEGPERTRRRLEDKPTLEFLFTALVAFPLVGQVAVALYVRRQQRILVALGQTVVLQSHFRGQSRDVYVVACIAGVEDTQIASTVELPLSLEGGSETPHGKLFELVLFVFVYLLVVWAIEVKKAVG